MEYPYNVKEAQIDKQDIGLLYAETEKTFRKLQRRNNIKNILLLHLMATMKIEDELKRMTEEEKKLCVNEIKEVIRVRIPDVFQDDSPQAEEKPHREMSCFEKAKQSERRVKTASDCMMKIAKELFLTTGEFDAAADRVKREARITD